MIMVNARLTNLCEEIDVVVPSPSESSNKLRGLRDLKKAFRNSMYIRTVCNSWCTSYRMHESGYGEVCCPDCQYGPDKLSHSGV